VYADISDQGWRWEPHPGAQQAALQRQEKELLFGGARGGGKTDFGIVAMVMPAVARDESGAFLYPYYRGLVLRRHSEDLSDWVDRADAIYSRYGGKKAGRPPFWRFPSGAVIRTGHLRDQDAYTKYQGHEYQRMLIEEVQLIPSEALYERLLGSCRSIHPGLSPQILLTANPGGPGTTWLKNRFVKVYDARGNKIPYGTPFKDPKAGHYRIYIPATIDANPTLLKNDPGYLAYLNSLPPALHKAWRYGDWDAIEGSFFPEFRPNGPLEGEPAWANHVVPKGRVKLEPWWHRSMSADWGYDHPAAVHWYCQTPEGQVHIYRELHVRQLSAQELGARIARETIADLRLMPDPRITVSLDPSAWRKVDEGKTPAEQIRAGIDATLGQGTAVLLGADDRPVEGVMPQHGQMAIVLRQADNQRVAGWTNMREYLRWRPLFPGETKDVVLPKLQIWDSCPHAIDQISSLIFSENKAEDAEKLNAIDGRGGDDAAESVRYGLMGFKARDNAPPLEVYLAERLASLNKQYGGNPDPTIAYMVAQHAEATYNRKFTVASPVTYSRLSSRRKRFVN
jgi:hypothetical protein